MITAEKARKNKEIFIKNKDFIENIMKQIKDAAEKGGYNIRIPKDDQISEVYDYFVNQGYKMIQDIKDGITTILISWI